MTVDQLEILMGMDQEVKEIIVRIIILPLMISIISIRVLILRL